MGLESVQNQLARRLLLASHLSMRHKLAPLKPPHLVRPRYPEKEGGSLIIKNTPGHKRGSLILKNTAGYKRGSLIIKNTAGHKRGSLIIKNTPGHKGEARGRRSRE